MIPSFLVRPHKDAPLFSDPVEAQVKIEQLITEITSSNPQLTGEIRELLRQASLVNLWFFLKFVAGFAGPYDKLNRGLHLDMCNFRQSDYCMKGGARAAAFIPRGHFKSTIFTHGANTWELVRNPDLRIRIVNAIIDKAIGFKRITQRTFDSNELFAWLFPKYVPEKGASRWNEEEMVLPNRSKSFNEPSIKVGGATGASEGDHHDLINIDDLVGLEDLDKEHKVNASMMQRITWAKTSTRALLVDWVDSRIMWVATLYASDDVYNEMILRKNMYRLIGYQDEDMLDMVKPDLSDAEERYTVYYRQVIERDEPIFPEGGFTKAKFEVMLQEDPWTAMAQYMNKPTNTGMAEFYQMATKRCSVRFDEKINDWVIIKRGVTNFVEENDSIRLSKCDVVMTIDPAGTDKGMSARTSRTSIGVWAMDSKGNAYRIWQKVGYISPTEMFDSIFEGHGKFKGYIRATFVESNAMQKLIAPLLVREQWSRELYINPQPIMATGDKVARIRNNVGLALSQERIYLAEGCVVEFEEEKRGFPVLQFRMDVLDETEKALTVLRRAPSDEEVYEEEERELDYRENTSNNVVGY